MYGSGLIRFVGRSQLMSREQVGQRISEVTVCGFVCKMRAKDNMIKYDRSQPDPWGLAWCSGNGNGPAGPCRWGTANYIFFGLLRVTHSTWGFQSL